MDSAELFQTLTTITERPPCWSVYTAERLWNDPYISSKMLEFHLDENVEPASRNKRFIDRSAGWIVDRFILGRGASALLDLGCGPGLYAEQFARAGAHVVGVDFSERSLAYARQSAAKQKLDIEYIRSNYLQFNSEQRFDLITLIYCDYCALSPDQRKRLLDMCRKHLKESGRLLLDVFSMASFDSRQEEQAFGRSFMGGFWSEGDYYGFLNRFKYDREKVILDKYTNVEPDRSWEVYNWLQYFSPETLRVEFESNGWRVVEQWANVAGDEYYDGAPEIAVEVQVKQ